MDVDERLPTKYPTLYLAMGSSLTGVGWLPLPDACKARTPWWGIHATPFGHAAHKARPPNELANGSRWPASEISDGGSDRYCLSARALISTDRENAFDDGRRNAFSNAARPRFLWRFIDKAQFLANYGADDFRSCR